MHLPEVTTGVVARTSLADFTGHGLILPRLRERDPAGIIGELSHALQRQGDVRDLLPFYQAALNQELLASSVLDCGIAFPHARMSGIGRLRFAFGRLAQPVVWSVGSTVPAHIVFLIASPASAAADYLHLVAGLSRLGQQPSVLAALREAPGVQDILRVLASVGVLQEGK